MVFNGLGFDYFVEQTVFENYLPGGCELLFKLKFPAANVLKIKVSFIHVTIGGFPASSPCYEFP